jgi:hypothetical protein
VFWCLFSSKYISLFYGIGIYIYIYIYIYTFTEVKSLLTIRGFKLNTLASLCSIRRIILANLEF